MDLLITDVDIDSYLIASVRQRQKSKLALFLAEFRNSSKLKYPFLKRDILLPLAYVYN